MRAAHRAHGHERCVAASDRDAYVRGPIVVPRFSRDRAKDFALFIAIFATTWIAFIPFASLGVDPHHDGIMLKPAMDVASGQTLFRDTFTQYGALTTYLHVAALKLLGPTLRSLRVFNVFAYAVGITVFAAAWRRVMSRTLVAVAFGVWLIFAPFYHPAFSMIPWSSVAALPFQGAALIFLLRSIAPDNRDDRVDRIDVNAVAAGVFAGMTFWCRMPVGIVHVVALVMVYALLLRRSIAACIASFSSAIALGVAHLKLHGALLPWWEQNVEWPRRWAARQAMHLEGVAQCLLPGGEDAATLPLIFAIYAVPVLVPMGPRLRVACYVALLGVTVAFHAAFDLLLVVTGGWQMAIPLIVLAYALDQIRRVFVGREVDRVGLCLGITSVASWAQYYPIPCPRHTFWALTPAFGTLVYIASRLSRTERLAFLGASRGDDRAVAAVFAIAFAAPAVERFRLARATLAAPYVALDGTTVLAGMKVRPTMRELATVERQIRDYGVTHPNAALMTIGPDALYGTFSRNLTNPGPIYVDWPIGGVAAREARDHFVRANHPLIVVQGKSAEALAAVERTFGYVEVASFASLDLRLLSPAPSPP